MTQALAVDSAAALDAARLAANRWTLWRTLARGLAHSLANASQILALEPLPAMGREEARERLARAAVRLTALQRADGEGPITLADPFSELEACQSAQIGFPSIALEFALSPRLPALAVPESDLLHALLALVTNAREAAAGGRPHVCIRAEGVQGGVRITVEDDGPGFSKQARALAFEPGAAPRDAEHLGLGLWAARTLLRRAGGDVTLGEGSAVRVRVPAWPAPLRGRRTLKSA